MFYWLAGAASVLAGSTVVSGVDLSPSADPSTMIISLLAAYFLTAFGGLLWIVAGAKMSTKKKQ